MKNYIDFKGFKKSEIPEDVKISTMSTTCKLGTTIHIEKLYKYLELDNSSVITLKYNGKIRTIDPTEKKKMKKPKKNFYNQITLVVTTSKGRTTKQVVPTKAKKINVKLFRNGSVQMTGCKRIEDCNTVLGKLVKKLSLVYGRKKRGKMVDIQFVENINELKVTGFKIDMINSNFEMNYPINRDALYNILLEKKIECRFEPCIHACVNIKKQEADKKVSIFVFQSGNIIITGAKTSEHIANSYQYIRELLRMHYEDVRQKDISALLESGALQELLED